MVSPQTLVRNAGGAKRRPRWWMMAQYNAANNTRIIKAEPRPAKVEAQEPLQRPWWRTVFGG